MEGSNDESLSSTSETKMIASETITTLTTEALTTTTTAIQTTTTTTTLVGTGSLTNLAPLDAMDEELRVILGREDRWLATKLSALPPGRKPSLDFFGFIYEMLQEYSLKYKALGYEGTEKDLLDVFYLFFEQLIPRCDSRVRLVVTKKLNGIILSSSLVKDYCCDLHWLSRLLNLLRYRWLQNDVPLVEELFVLMKILGLYNMNVADLQCLFHLLIFSGKDNPSPSTVSPIQLPNASFNSNKAGSIESRFKPPLLELLFRFLGKKEEPSGAVTGSTGGNANPGGGTTGVGVSPSLCFSFSGHDSGLIIPMKGKQWPVAGYGVCCWLRIESFSDPSGMSNYQPRIFSFLTDEGLGVESYFSANRLSMRSSPKAGENTILQFSFDFKAKQWYFIAISHTYSMLWSSMATLFVNGAKVDSRSLTYPRALRSLPLTKCHIANDDSLLQPLYGQMGTIFCFQEPLIELDVARIYSLGPNLQAITNPQDMEVLTGQKGNVFVFDTKRKVPLLFAYNPKATDGLLCYDTSTAPAVMNYQATRMEGVRVLHATSAKECFYCAGGIKLIVGLFSLDAGESGTIPVAQRGKTTGAQTQSGGSMAIGTQQQFLFRSLLLLLNMLEYDKSNQKEILACHGFQVIGLLLHRYNRHAWSREAVAVLDKIAHFTSSIEPLYREYFVHVMMNFHIWARTDFLIQSSVIKILSRHVLKRPKYFRSLMGVSGYLDVIRRFYSLPGFSASSSISSSASAPAPPARATIPVTLNSQERTQIRLFILQTIRFLVPDNLTEKEKECVIDHLRRSHQTERGDVFQAFAPFLPPGFDPSTMMGSNTLVAKTSGSSIFRNLLKSSNEDQQANRNDKADEITIPSLFERNKHFFEKKWKNILRSLHDDAADSQKLFWKLDRTETPLRMRKRLRRNYHGSCHEGRSRAFKKEAVSSPSLPAPCKQDMTGDSKHTIKVKTAQETIEETNPPAAHFPTPSPAPSSGEAQVKVLLKTTCSIIKSLRMTQGVLKITSDSIYFLARKLQDSGVPSSSSSSSSPSDKRKSYIWALKDLVSVYRRSYLFRSMGLELFFADRVNYFLLFQDEKSLEKVIALISSLSLPLLGDKIYTMRPEKLFLKLEEVTKKWRKRQISNFEYLMHLNTVAGRTYNDLNQYPIFPWVIADYTSSTLDLQSPSTYRDLSKPIGALNEKRLESFLERYRMFDDDTIPKFLYGSHYSSVGIVLYYLIRLEPFTSEFLSFQGGHFDHTERMFTSIPRTWNAVLNDFSDVKELVPEFFYMPEFLCNVNGVKFGEMQQSQQPMGDVGLPPWARSPEEFVRINREALESEYVSANLHKWIDLIFGCKQRGKAAEEAENVFYYLTYDNIDLDSIEDSVERKSVEAQILNFGQCPAQLTTKPHPQRMTKEELSRPRKIDIIFNALGYFVDNVNTPTSALPLMASSSSSSVSPTFIGQGYVLWKDSVTVPLVHISSYQDRVILVYLDGALAVNRFATAANGAYSYEIDKTLRTSQQKQLDILFSVEELSSIARCFCISPDGKMLFWGGNYDNSFKCSFVDTARGFRSYFSHNDTVTCLVLAKDGDTLVTASSDATARLWSLKSLVTKKKPHVVPDHIFRGHTAGVTCVDIDLDLDIVVTGSRDMTCRIYSLQKKKLLRSLPFRETVHLVKIASNGNIVAYCGNSHTHRVSGTGGDLRYLYLYSVNGKLLNVISLTEVLYDLILTSNGNYVLTGGTDGAVVVRNTENLEVVCSFISPTTIRSLALVFDDSYLFIGLENGRSFIFPFPISRLNSF